MTTTTSTIARRDSVSRALRAETIKSLTTRTMPLALLLTAVTATVTLAAITSLAVNASSEPLAPEWGLTGLFLTALPIFLIWAASLYFGETGNGILYVTYIGIPGRITVLLAKTVLAIAVGAVLVGILMPFNQLVYAALAGQKEMIGYLFSGAGLFAGLRLVFVVACWAIIAVSVGAITHNLALSAGFLIVDYLFLEAYLGDIPALPWLAYVLPFTPGKALFSEASDVSLPCFWAAGIGQFLIAIFYFVMAVIATRIRAHR